MKVKAIMGTVSYALKKYSPEILLGTGIVGVVGSTVLACKATLKCDEILTEYEARMDRIDDCVTVRESSEVDYPVELENKDRFVVKAQAVGAFVKLYGPSMTLMGVSIGCILGSYRIMSKRNVALMAAYKVVEEAFSKYRGRVVEELGAAKDAQFMYGTSPVEHTVVDEDGNERTVKGKEDLIPGVKLSGFARVFAPETPDQYGSWEGSTQWSRVHDYNLSFLEAKMIQFNDMLVSKGFVTINDVYQELGFPCTEAGMICGWRYKSARGDGYINFKPREIDGNWAFGVDGDPIVLDFNIDGVIFDQGEARRELI